MVRDILKFRTTLNTQKIKFFKLVKHEAIYFIFPLLYLLPSNRMQFIGTI